MSKTMWYVRNLLTVRAEIGLKSVIKLRWRHFKCNLQVKQILNISKVENTQFIKYLLPYKITYKAL